MKLPEITQLHFHSPVIHSPLGPNDVRTCLTLENVTASLGSNKSIGSFAAIEISGRACFIHSDFPATDIQEPHPAGAGPLEIEDYADLLGAMKNVATATFGLLQIHLGHHADLGTVALVASSCPEKYWAHVDAHGLTDADRYMEAVREATNKYGTVDVRRGVPRGLMVVKGLNGPASIMKMLKVDYAEALIGMKQMRGKYVPVFDGIVVHERDFERVMRVVDSIAAAQADIAAAAKAPVED